jgi:hypothetical protein
VKFAFGCLAAWFLVFNASAFSLLGPIEEWQTPELGYFAPEIDVGGPKNIGEEYRWNVPVITYGFDEAFMDYFGKAGVAAVDSAFDILNSLPAASQMQLTSFPTIVRLDNYRATSQNLLDLKSAVLALVVEQLGLASPERYVWTLRARSVYPDQPFTNYYVVQRNFDPYTFLPSRFVNGTRYTYEIDEFANPDFADAVDIPIDPEYARSSVAGWLDYGYTYLSYSGPYSGAFLYSLSQDDAGGLRYLLDTNNVNYEALPSGVTARDGSSNYVDHALRPGLDKLAFQKISEQWFGNPNWSMDLEFSDTYVMDGLFQKQELTRRIFRPDIVFSAGDSGVTAGYVPFQFSRSTPNRTSLMNDFDQPGPGTLQGPVTIKFSKLGGVININPGSLGEPQGFYLQRWGWFNASPLSPIEFPIASNRGADSSIYLSRGDADPATVVVAIRGYPNLEYVVESSSDLKTWSEVKRVSSATGLSQFSVSSEDGTRRFYRVSSRL